jgi:hypothetical protein
VNDKEVVDPFENLGKTSLSADDYEHVSDRTENTSSGCKFKHILNYFRKCKGDVAGQAELE